MFHVKHFHSSTICQVTLLITSSVVILPLSVFWVWWLTRSFRWDIKFYVHLMVIFYIWASEIDSFSYSIFFLHFIFDISAMNEPNSWYLNHIQLFHVKHCLRVSYPLREEKWDTRSILSLLQNVSRETLFCTVIHGYFLVYSGISAKTIAQSMQPYWISLSVSVCSQIIGFHLQKNNRKCFTWNIFGRSGSCLFKPQYIVQMNIYRNFGSISSSAEAIWSSSWMIPFPSHIFTSRIW